MTLPTSPDELRALIVEASQALAVTEAAAAQAQVDRRVRIAATIGKLDALQGPEDAGPGTGSIRAVRGYDGQTMVENAAVALPLIFEGLEILTSTVLDLARVIGSD